LSDLLLLLLFVVLLLLVGWGGLLKINNKEYLIKDLLKPKKLNIIIDLKRYLELITCMILTNKKYIFGPIIWYLLYASGILTKSITCKYLFKKYPGMGIIGEKLLLNINFSSYYSDINRNFRYLYNNLKDIKQIQLPIIPHINNKVVSPRFPFYVEPKDKVKLMDFMDSRKLGIGEWFHHSPSVFSDNLITDCKNANDVMKKVLNIPIHSTIKIKDLEKYVIAIKIFYK
jgi:hypothetical protein